MNSSHIKEKEFQTKLSVYKNRILQLGQNNKEYLQANKQQATKYIQQLIKLNIDTTTITALNIFSNEDELLNLTIYLLKIISENNMMNGGLITLKELQYHFSNYNIMISKKNLIDIVSNHFNYWDSGISLLYLENKKKPPIVRCFPMEISSDHETVLNLLKTKNDLGEESFISMQELKDTKEWSVERSSAVLTDMVQIGILWIDDGNDELGQRTFWDYSTIYN